MTELTQNEMQAIDGGIIPLIFAAGFVAGVAVGTAIGAYLAS